MCDDAHPKEYKIAVLLTHVSGIHSRQHKIYSCHMLARQRVWAHARLVTEGLATHSLFVLATLSFSPSDGLEATLRSTSPESRNSVCLHHVGEHAQLAAATAAAAYPGVRSLAVDPGLHEERLPTRASGTPFSRSARFGVGGVGRKCSPLLPVPRMASQAPRWPERSECEGEGEGECEGEGEGEGEQCE